MRRPHRLQMVLVLVVLAGLVALGVGSCGGQETAPPDTAPVPGTSTVEGTTTTTALDTTMMIDPFSLYEAKDPFIQQALPPSTTTSGTGTTGTTGSTTSTTGGSSTSTNSSTTSTTHTSHTTNALHSLKVLAIDVVNGVPVVTFEVDDTIYEDKKEGDIVNTSWGQIKVIDIDPATQTVVVLHGSETRVMQVGQSILK